MNKETLQKIAGIKPIEQLNEAPIKNPGGPGYDPSDKEYELPGIDDVPGYDVFGGKHGPRIKNAVAVLVRSGYSEGEILHYVRKVIQAAKKLK